MSEQLSLFDMPDGIVDNANDAGGSAVDTGYSKISCCSRYRQCSELGRCLIAGTDIANDCRYRLKLEAGEVFFGKRAKYFSQADYDRCCEQFEQMSESERIVFLDCLYHFCDRCFSVCFARRSAELESLAERKLIFLYPFSTEMVYRMDIYKGMYPLLQKIDAMGKWREWEKVVKVERGGGLARPTLCAEFLLKKYPSELEAYFADLCAIDITPDARLRFADEFYSDYGAPRKAQLHDLPDPLLSDMRFKRGK